MQQPPPKKLWIAAFDFDWTLVKPRSDGILASSKDDWQWLYSDTVQVLKKYWKSGYSIVVITNQRHTYKKEQVREALKSIVKEIPHILIVIGEGRCIKPNKNLFPFPLECIDVSKSFFVGDAGGDMYDWSDMDKEFATNVGIPYKRPEDIFRGVIDMSYGLDLTHPRTYTPIEDQQQEQEAIIMVGYAGSGKSTYVREHFVPKGYVHIESDVSKTKTKAKAKDKINKMVTDSIMQGRCIVVDATNPSKERRDEIRAIIHKAQASIKHRIRITTVWMNTPRVVSWHRNIRRENSAARVPEIAYHVYAKHFVEPTDDENVFTVYEKAKLGEP
jgi:bifunctional polynucleotide phosphatase/kinase